MALTSTPVFELRILRRAETNERERDTLVIAQFPFDRDKLLVDRSSGGEVALIVKRIADVLQPRAPRHRSKAVKPARPTRLFVGSNHAPARGRDLPSNRTVWCREYIQKEWPV